MIKLAETCGCDHIYHAFAKEILNWELHFLCNVTGWLHVACWPGSQVGSVSRLNYFLAESNKFYSFWLYEIFITRLPGLLVIMKARWLGKRVDFWPRNHSYRDFGQVFLLCTCPIQPKQKLINKHGGLTRQMGRFSKSIDSTHLMNPFTEAIQVLDQTAKPLSYNINYWHK